MVAQELGPVLGRGERESLRHVEAPEQRPRFRLGQLAQHRLEPVRLPLGGQRSEIVRVERTRQRELDPPAKSRRGARGVAVGALAQREVEQLVRARRSDGTLQERDRREVAQLPQRPRESIAHFEERRLAVELLEHAALVAAFGLDAFGDDDRVIGQLEADVRAGELVLEARVLEQQAFDGERRAEHGVAARTRALGAGLGSGDGRGLRRLPRHRAGEEAEVDLVRVEHRVERLDALRARDVRHAQRVDAEVGVLDPRLSHSVAPDLGVLVRVRQEVQLPLLDTQGCAQVALRAQREDPVPAARQTLEQVREANTADVALEAHLVPAISTPRDG